MQNHVPSSPSFLLAPAFEQLSGAFAPPLLAARKNGATQNITRNVQRKTYTKNADAHVSRQSCLQPPAPHHLLRQQTARRERMTHCRKEGATPVEQMGGISNKWQPRPILMIGTQVFRLDTCNVVGAAYSTK